MKLSVLGCLLVCLSFQHPTHAVIWVPREVRIDLKGPEEGLNQLSRKEWPSKTGKIEISWHELLCPSTFYIIIPSPLSGESYELTPLGRLQLHFFIHIIAMFSLTLFRLPKKARSYKLRMIKKQSQEAIILSAPIR